MYMYIYIYSIYMHIIRLRRQWEPSNFMHFEFDNSWSFQHELIHHLIWAIRWKITEIFFCVCTETC